MKITATFLFVQAISVLALGATVHFEADARIYKAESVFAKPIRILPNAGVRDFPSKVLTAEEEQVVYDEGILSVVRPEVSAYSLDMARDVCADFQAPKPRPISRLFFIEVSMVVSYVTPESTIKLFSTAYYRCKKLLK